MCSFHSVKFNSIKTILDDHEKFEDDYPYQEIYLVRLLELTHANLFKRLKDTFVEYQLSDIRYLILFTIEGKQEQGIKPSVLSDMFNISRVQITRHINILEEKGWIIRKNNPEDRRSQYIVLTHEGKKFFKTVVSPIKRKLVEAWQVIDQTEKDELARILTKLFQRISQSDANQHQ